MKNLFVTILLLFSSTIYGQKYFTKSGMTEFKASVPAFEPVEAKNNSSTAVLDCDKREVAVLLFVNAFHFEVALMEEHFNENYMDTDKYPKATFSGSLLDFDIKDLGLEAKPFLVEGELTIKGISKALTTTINLSLVEDKIIVSHSFSVNPGDYEIKIPSIVKNKISEKITISLAYEMDKKS